MSPFHCSKAAIVRLRCIDPPRVILLDNLDNDRHGVVRALVPDIMQMPAAEIDCTVAYAVDARLAQAVVFVDGNLPGRHRDETGP